ncbi:MAG: GNAT family N-acetyltransferase [Clostridia bacterium]|nr:GNAT family N-acetyltransferase [Clostridia bacterium]
MREFHIFRPEEGKSKAGDALSFMLAEESPGKSYADAMRARVSGALVGECTDTYFVALDGDDCVSRLWYGWGTHESAIGNFGNFLTLEEYRGQGIGTRLLEMWYADLQARDDVPLALFCTSAPKAALMYEKYGMRPIAQDAAYGPSYMPLGKSPARFADFCDQFYQPASCLLSSPASFAYRHEIDCLLKFALSVRGESLGIGEIPSAEHAILYAPDRTQMLFTERGTCVGWSVDGQVQVHPAYRNLKIER